MKRIISGVLALGVCLTPLTVPLMIRPSWGQSQNLQEEVQRLLQQATQQKQQGQPLQAIATLQEVLGIARQYKLRETEAIALLAIGFNYQKIEQKQEALNFYKQALAIWQEVNNRDGKATTLNNIGSVYRDIGQPQEALKYYNQALAIRREMNDRAGEVTTLNNIGYVYQTIGQLQDALKYYNLALPISREVNDRTEESTTLNNMGLVYKDIRQPPEALKYFNLATRQYLIQKYPINYLTRLSPRSLLVTRSFPLLKNLATLPGIAAIIIISSIAIWMCRKFGVVPTGVLIIILSGGGYFFIVQPNTNLLALANPIPRDPQNLPGTEEEVRNIAQLFPGSESFFHNNATLDKFKTFAPRFPFLHLATHGCFQPEGCQKLGMKANTLLFADQQLNIADAALLGLQNTELLTLSACQTALQANSNGEEIAGLAYIFERAGAKAVMASLWNAEDNTTKDIMIQFYQNVKNGMSKGEALQKAKLSEIGHHPYYWSPFILIGDAR